MRADHTKIDRLAKLQETIFKRDLAQYRDVQLTIETLTEEIESLRIKLASAPDDMGIQASELSYWNKHRQWIESRIVFLNQNLATARAISTERQQQLARSNGRREVIGKLQGRR